MQSCALMPDIYETYIELVVGRMVKDGRIERIGPKNSSRYVRGGEPRGLNDRRRRRFFGFIR